MPGTLLCITLRGSMGWEGGRGSRGRGYVYTMAVLCCYMAETNKMLYSNYPPIEKKNGGLTPD